MVVMADGLSLIAAGLDPWFVREPGSGDTPVDPKEFMVAEWRLEKHLRVSHFRLPPDHRSFRFGQTAVNGGLTLPYLRFPQWHTCPRCGSLSSWPLTMKDRVKCQECRAKGRTSFLVQVRFVAMCDHGHLQDFPWREWVHRTARPTCDGKLRIVSTGSAALAGQFVHCSCGVPPRSLSGITGADADDTSSVLTDQLEPGSKFGCPGHMPWLGLSEGVGCGQPLRGSLRSASNLYFAIVNTAIYIPLEVGGAPSELVAALQGPPISTWLQMLKSALADAAITPANLKKAYPVQMHEYTEAQIAGALAGLEAAGQPAEAPPAEDVEHAVSDDEFRLAEFQVLRSSQDRAELVVHEPVGEYEERLVSSIQRVRLVERLRETRVLAGFNRVFAESGLPMANRKEFMRRQSLAARDDWLPAYVVHGEGIFFELDEGRLRTWERQPEVDRRVNSLVAQWHEVQSRRHLADRELHARFVLVHTLAHLLMNRLTYECGYSTASLRERLYVSADAANPMAGLLIYTAAGDSDGTMGGLVRMGKPGRLEPVVARALEEAHWCSADPVCMEAADQGGQGPDSCNLAACHNCALVPETACEQFNRFLDRGLVVGWPGHPEGGFFAEF